MTIKNHNTYFLTAYLLNQWLKKNKKTSKDVKLDSFDSHVRGLSLYASNYKVQFESCFDPVKRWEIFLNVRSKVESARWRRGYLAPLRCTTIVPATMSYTVLLCWKKRRVMKTGKRNAMEKFLLSARTVELWK